MAEQKTTPARPCFACGKDGAHSVCSGCRQALYCGAPCQRAHWKAGHKLQCKDHFKRLQSSVRRAFCISGQAVFKLRLTAVEGRDIIAATDISKGSVIICPLLYDCVFDQIPRQLPQFMNLLSTMEPAAALIQTIYHGIQEPMSDLMKRSCERVEVECVKQGATRAQRRLIHPVISLLANMSYATTGPCGMLSVVQHALMFINHSSTPNVQLRYTGGDFGFALLVLRDIPTGTSVRSCYYENSIDAHALMHTQHPGVPLSDVERRLLVPVTGNVSLWDVLSSEEAPSSAGFAYVWKRVRDEPADLGDVDWNELFTMIHAFVQIFGTLNGVDMTILFTSGHAWLIFKGILDNIGAERIQDVLREILMHAKTLFDRDVVDAHIVSSARRVHGTITTFETFWETLGVKHMLARYKNLSTRLREDLNADTTHVDAIYDMKALERESLMTY